MILATITLAIIDSDSGFEILFRSKFISFKFSSHLNLNAAWQDIL